MIVDVHTRIWDTNEPLGASVTQQLCRFRTEPWERLDGSLSSHEAAMKPVDTAIVLGFESLLLGASISHETVAGHVNKHPNKLIGFAGIDPNGSDPMGSLEQALSLGLQGVVVSPALQGFHPSSTKAVELLETCQERRIPVMIEFSPHLSPEARFEFTSPMLFDEVLRHLPNLKIVLGSLGYPHIAQALTLLAKHPNVYADFGNLATRPWELYNAMVTAHQQGLMEQLLFGSNFPFCTPERAIMTAYSVNGMSQGTNLPTVPREQIRSIIERDALRCLGLQKHSSAPTKAGGASSEAAGKPTNIKETVSEG